MSADFALMSDINSGPTNDSGYTTAQTPVTAATRADRAEDGEVDDVAASADAREPEELQRLCTPAGEERRRRGERRHLATSTSAPWSRRRRTADP